MSLFNFNCLVSPWITFFTCVGGSPDCERCTAGSLRWFWEGQMRSTSFAPDHGRECHLSLNFGVLKVKSCESWKIREYTTFFFEFYHIVGTFLQKGVIVMVELECFSSECFSSLEVRHQQAGLNCVLGYCVSQVLHFLWKRPLHDAVIGKSWCVFGS